MTGPSRCKQVHLKDTAQDLKVHTHESSGVIHHDPTKGVVFFLFPFQFLAYFVNDFWMSSHRPRLMGSSSRSFSSQPTESSSILLASP